MPQVYVSDHSKLTNVLPYGEYGWADSPTLWPFFCFSEGLGEAYDGDIAFASSLEIFGGGHNDPISVAFGG